MNYFRVNFRMLQSVVIRALVIASLSFTCRAEEPFADIHIHFNWDQKEIIGAPEIIEKLRAGNVEFAVVAGTPSALALELKKAGGDLIVPLFSPYTHELGKQDWFLDERTVRLAAEGLGKKQYRGIGEVHFMAGFRPATDNGIFLQLMQLARIHAVPVLIHIDSANEKMFLNICRKYPRLKLLFAHAGGNLGPRHIRQVIEQCDNAMIEFSARDPWRYGGLTGDDGRLLPAWRELVIEYPDRFMTGTDPVWKVTRTQSWDQADDGWDYFEQLLAYHRKWIEDLPQTVRQKIRIDNARRFFNIR